MQGSQHGRSQRYHLGLVIVATRTRRGSFEFAPTTNNDPRRTHGHRRRADYRNHAVTSTSLTHRRTLSYIEPVLIYIDIVHDYPK